MRVVFFIICIGCIVSFSHTVFAQKIAHISYSSVLKQLPEWDSLQQVINTYEKKINNDVKDKAQVIQDAIQRLYGEFEGSRQQLRKAEAKIEQQVNALKQEKATIPHLVAEKRDRLETPIHQKVKAMITIVAQKRGYQYVLDSSKNQKYLLFANPKADLTHEVIDQIKNDTR